MYAALPNMNDTTWMTALIAHAVVCYALGGVQCPSRLRLLRQTAMGLQHCQASTTIKNAGFWFPPSPYISHGNKGGVKADPARFSSF